MRVPGSADPLAALAGPAAAVAPLLLGAVLRSERGSGPVAVRLSEVEAYAGADDPGSHAFRGPTTRTAVMFGPAGRLYVYFTYGMHHCCNVVVGAEGTAAAVLLRAGEVVEGVALARERRGGARDRDLARGPARLCAALGIDRSCDGLDLRRPPVTLHLGEPPDPARLRTGPRVGLRHAADRPWRFWLDGERTVSPYRPAAVRRAPATRDAVGNRTPDLGNR